MKHSFVRRSLLYVPGSSLKMMNKALTVECDSIIFDLEDAVSFQEKDNARKNVAEFITTAKQTCKEVIVRVNVPNTFLGIQDILAIVPEGPDTLIIPKADEKTIIMADNMITAIEENLGWEANRVKLVPLLETTYSIVNAYKILSSSSRINGVQFGAEDLTKELGIARTRSGDEIQYARNTIVFAGRTLNIDVIDSPFTDIKDDEGLIADTNRVKAMGMTGKTCIHPNQVVIVNEVFDPKLEEIQYARRVVEAFEISIKEGKGACNLDGKMIDNPIFERAKKIIEKAEMIRK